MIKYFALGLTTGSVFEIIGLDFNIGLIAIVVMLLFSNRI